ncbi:hypothetical protein [Nisaea sp.]|uniref:hypothetical protein n=1 Tax=Nisaea sp. TaxID=2024842 RepID=UPI002B26F691|nr:hypothetical protein [Nisaea sp.]
MSADPQTPEHHPKHDEKPRWLDDQRNVNKIIVAIVVVCALLFAADGFYHKHPHFEAESWFGFYAIYGFIMCVGLVLAAKLMRVFLMRDEDYYDHDR